jgi:hypothetical protein
MTTTPPQKLWVLLKSNDSAVVNYPTQVPTKECDNVDDFMEAIKKKLSPKLDQVAVDNITLHRTEDSLALERDDPLPAQNTKQTALVVKAQPIAGSPTSWHSSRSSRGGPHPKRLKLWDELNTDFALAGITSNDGSTPFSSITWPIVEDTLRPVYVKYKQDAKPIPADKLDLLVEWLSTIYKCFGAQLTGSSSNNEAKRVHLIAPIIWVVVSILDGVTVDVERTIRGRRIKANGQFEFMLKRQNKRICIVVAKSKTLTRTSRKTWLDARSLPIWMIVTRSTGLLRLLRSGSFSRVWMVRSCSMRMAVSHLTATAFLIALSWRMLLAKSIIFCSDCLCKLLRRCIFAIFIRSTNSINGILQIFSCFILILLIVLSKSFSRSLLFVCDYHNSVDIRDMWWLLITTL